MKPFTPTEATDAQLLTRFERNADQAAFAELVRRYGPMVLATARRLLRRPEDVEEAFQATMFALAKASGTLKRKAAVAGWLHKTTHRCAAEIYRGNVRWEKNVDEMAKRQKSKTHANDAETNPLLGAANGELVRILDIEIAELSEPLRDVIVLCELQGLPQKAVAKRLGVPTSTVNDRTARGRKVLHQRLVRRGATLTLAGVVSRVGEREASAAISEVLVKETTTKAMHFAAGKSASDIGVSSSVVHAANQVKTVTPTVKIFAALGIAAAFAVTMVSLTAFDGRNLRALNGSASSVTLFYDDFEDGDTTNNQPVTPDGIPVIWRRHGGSKVAISDGKLVTQGPTFDLATTQDIPNIESRLMLDDMSIRTCARLIEGNAVVINPLRQVEGPRPGYLGLIEDGGIRILYGGTLEQIESVKTDFNISQERLMIQFDLFIDRISLWIWRPGEAMPQKPVLSMTDAAIPATGNGDVALGVLGPSSKAEFEFVHVATKSITDGSP